MIRKLHERLRISADVLTRPLAFARNGTFVPIWRDVMMGTIRASLAHEETGSPGPATQRAEEPDPVREKAAWDLLRPCTMSNCDVPLLFGYVTTVPRGPSTRRAQEQLASIRKGDIAAIGSVRAVLRTVSVDDDFGAFRQRAPRQTTAKQRVRRASLDHPARRLAVRLLDIDVNPGVRVDPLDLRHRSAQLYGFVRVELGGERVVR